MNQIMISPNSIVNSDLVNQSYLIYSDALKVEQSSSPLEYNQKQKNQSPCCTNDTLYSFCPTCGVDVSIFSHENHCPSATTTSN